MSEEPVFHEKPEVEQEVASMRRNVRRWSKASAKAWRTRKKLAETRAALEQAERE